MMHLSFRVSAFNVAKRQSKHNASLQRLASPRAQITKAASKIRSAFQRRSQGGVPVFTTTNPTATPVLEGYGIPELKQGAQVAKEAPPSPAPVSKVSEADAIAFIETAVAAVREVRPTASLPPPPAHNDQGYVRSSSAERVTIPNLLAHPATAPVLLWQRKRKAREMDEGTSVSRINTLSLDDSSRRIRPMKRARFAPAIDDARLEPTPTPPAPKPVLAEPRFFKDMTSITSAFKPQPQMLAAVVQTGVGVYVLANATWYGRLTPSIHTRVLAAPRFLKDFAAYAK